MPYLNKNLNTMPNVNETLNNSCDMEIEDSQFLSHQSNVDVVKESMEFQNKLNCFTFSQNPVSNDYNKKEQIGQNTNKTRNVEYRQIIDFKDPIKISAKASDLNMIKNTISKSIRTSTQSVDLSQNEVSKHKDESARNLKLNEINILHVNERDIDKENSNRLRNVKSRHTINFNEPIVAEDLNDENKNVDIASDNNLKSKKINVLKDHTEPSPVDECYNIEDIVDVFKNTKPRRPTIHFNQSIAAEALNQENNKGAIPKIQYRPTININQSIEISPIKTKTDIPSQTINYCEDIAPSPQKTSKQCDAGSHDSSQKPKLVVRKIYTSSINKNTNTNVNDVEQQKLIRNKKKDEEKSSVINISTNIKTNEIETSPVTKNSLNFLVSSINRMSLSPDSSSFLIPSEFKAYNLKQLNDDIEKGKIHVFSNAPKTPGTDRKLRTSSHFGSENIQHFHIPAKHRRTLVFQNEDILLTSNDSLKGDITNEESNEKKSNIKCRYSQADDVMLDNTSFLAKAKLSDETVSRNSSRKEITQSLDFFDMCNESLETGAIDLNGMHKKK